MIVVPLPVGAADPAQRLQAINAETARRKQHRDEGIAGIVAMPASLARVGVAWGAARGRRPHQPVCHQRARTAGPLCLVHSQVPRPLARAARAR